MCAIGQENGQGGHAKLDVIRRNPDFPITLVCNAGDVFAYQDPGPADDRDGSAEFNRMRDLEILQRLDLPRASPCRHALFCIAFGTGLRACPGSATSSK